MAFPGELVSLLATQLGMPLPTVTQHDRNLVIAGYRSKNGRGTSAAHVTTHDAAVLLTAVLGADKVKDSALAVQRYSEAKLRDGGWNGCGVAELESLPSDHSFVDAIEATIAAGMSGSLRRLLDGQPDSERTDQRRVIFPKEYQVEISAMTTYVVGAFVVRASRAADATYALPLVRSDAAGIDWKKHEADLDRLEVGGSDLRQTRKISARTILSVANLLR